MCLDCAVKSLGTQLREARYRGDWSQADLAEHLGVAKRTVQSWEAGLVTPYPKHRRKIRAWLGSVNGKVAA